MDIDFDNPVGAIIGFIILLLIISAIVPVFTSLADIAHQSQCSSEIAKIKDLGGQIDAIKAEKEGISKTLESCQKDYSDLINYNITKHDFDEIKSSLNQTNIYVNNVYSRLDNVENKINNFNRVTVNVFNFSFALNIVLAIEVLSFAFLKNEFLQWIWNITFRRHKKKKEEQNNADKK